MAEAIYRDCNTLLNLKANLKLWVTMLPSIVTADRRMMFVALTRTLWNIVTVNRATAHTGGRGGGII